jgi:hypothetical protein
MEEKDLKAQAAERLNWLKNAATKKFEELSAKAEELSDEAKVEAQEKMAKLAEMRKEIDKHEGGAMGFLAEKAQHLLDELKEDADEAVAESKSFWEKAKSFVSDKVDDAKEALKRDDDKIA